MLSRTSFFDPTLGLKGVKRTMPLWITHFIIWVMALPVMLANVMRYGDEAPHVLEVGEYVYQTVFVGGTLMACFFCAVIAGVLSNYLMSARSTSFYHSLPLRRSTVYTTHLIVTLGTLLVPAAVVGLMTWIVELSKGIHGGGIHLLTWWGVYAMMCLFFTGFALLCIHVTGHVAAAPIIYAILNFAAVVVEAVVRYIPTMFYYGVNYAGSITWTWLSPIVHIYDNCMPNVRYEYIDAAQKVRQPVELYFENVGYFGWLALAGVVMMGLAWLFYRMRHSEQAGEFIAITPLRPVFKYAVTLGFTLILSIVLYAISYMVRYGEDNPSALWFTVCMLISAAIGYFGSEMVLRKSFRVFKKSLSGFAVCAILVCFCGAALQFDLFGIEDYIPDGDRVEQLTLDASYMDYNLKILGNEAQYDAAVELQKMIIANEEENKAIWNGRYEGGLAEELSWHTTWIRFEYLMENGTKVRREYRVPVWKYDDRGLSIYDGVEDVFGYYRLLSDLHSDPVLVHRAYNIFFDDAHLWDIESMYIHPYNGWKDQEMIFSNACYGQLREAVRLDIQAGTILEGDRYGKTVEASEAQKQYSLYMDFRSRPVMGEDPDYYSYSFTVTPKAVHTYRLLSNMDNYVTAEQYERGLAAVTGN